VAKLFLSGLSIKIKTVGVCTAGLAKEFLAGFHTKNLETMFQESRLAHQYLDGLEGIEIGGASHNPFGLNTINVDNMEWPSGYNEAQMKLAGRVLPIDVIAEGDTLPFRDNQWDFVVSSHVLEHCFNPLKVLREWTRAVRSDGYIFTVYPDRNRCDAHEKRTTLVELIQRDKDRRDFNARGLGHQTFWVLEDMLEVLQYMDMPVIASLEVDDKVGNGFVTLVKVRK
jgi:SAM-dependent methyltransferase